MNEQAPKKRRGFAAMNPDFQRELASAGGVTAHILGKAHKFTSEEARAAGSKGGLASSRARAERRARQTP